MKFAWTSGRLMARIEELSFPDIISSLIVQFPYNIISVRSSVCSSVRSSVHPFVRPYVYPFIRPLVTLFLFLQNESMELLNPT